MTKRTFDELERAVASLSKNIADFPVGAISINDLKPTDERIRDMRQSLKALNAKILTLRAKATAQKSSESPEEGDEEMYDELQEKIAHCVINNIAINNCLQNSARSDILENPENDEDGEALKNLMGKLFILNDHLMILEETRARESDQELELKCHLQESLSEFRDFLKSQEDSRKKKLEETNPEIARQKESIRRRLQKINIMKRLITNLTAASSGIIKENPILGELVEKHHELLSAETVREMAREKDSEDS